MRPLERSLPLPRALSRGVPARLHPGTMHHLSGTIIKGKYRIDGVIGEGGMGVVFAAYHLALEKRVAIKFLKPHLLKHFEVGARFAREARAACRLESEHVVRVLDVDALEDGMPFMVMEYLDGDDLSVVRRGARPMSLSAAVDCILAACEALAEAHAAGIVHCDLKPGNLFLAKKRNGTTVLKVLDFGIAQVDGLGGTQAGITDGDSVMGSAQYMSPEQLNGLTVDGRADIWALGITLYELTTASVPFPGESLNHVCALLMTRPVPTPSSMRPEIPAAFDGVVLRCLERDRRDRFASIAELSTALAPFSSRNLAGGSLFSGDTRRADRGANQPPLACSRVGSDAGFAGVLV